MPWTRENKLAALMRLPWTVRVEQNPDEGYLVAHVAELPSVIATGGDQRELGIDLWESLQATLSAYLEFNDPIPLPNGAVLPAEPPAPVGEDVIGIELAGEAWAALHREAAASGGVRQLSLSAA